MRKILITLLLITFSCSLYTIQAYATDFDRSPTSDDAPFRGGSGAGWSFTSVPPAMFRGGDGSGSSVATMSTATTVGYGAATRLAFSTQPTNSIKNVILATSPVVEVRDTFGNRVLNATNNITIAILNNPGSATLGGTTSVTASSGRSTFSTLTINQNGTGYTFSASASGLISATSSTFNISSGSLVFTTQPSNALTNQPFTTMPVITIQDSLGNTVTTATDTITLVAQGGGGGTLRTSGGTTPVTKAAISGVANLAGSGIYVDAGGTGYTLLASAPGFPNATSSTFSIGSSPSASNVSAAQTTDGLKNVTISYKAFDPISAACNLTTTASQAQYSTDGSTWNDATISGTKTGITASPTGVDHADLIWNAGSNITNLELTNVSFRIKLHNGSGYATNYASTSTAFIVDTKSPRNVAITSPTDTFTDVSRIPTIRASTATDAYAVQYYFQIASNTSFTTDVQTSGWQSSSNWTVGTQLSLNLTYYVRVKAKDAYGNESVYCGPVVDTLGYTTFTTVQNANAQPTISSISAGQVTDGTKRVLITYTVADAESNPCNLTRAAAQAQYSIDGTTWNNATLHATSTTSSITAASGGTLHNAANQPLYWAAGTDLNNTEDSTVYFRIRLYDGSNYMSDYATTSAFGLDTKAPVNLTSTRFTPSPVAGDTSITLASTWTEGNPTSSLFYYALNGTTYSAGAAGTASSASPTYTTSVAVLQGHSYFSKIKSTLTDAYNNATTSEDLTGFGVKPYTPLAPTVTNAVLGACEVTVNKNASEGDLVQYAIYLTPGVGESGYQYVQADGSVGASAVWLTRVAWGTRVVSGLANSTTYSFKVQARNPTYTAVVSDWSDVDTISIPTPGQTPTVKVDYSYNATTDTLTFATWLESGGAVIVPATGVDSVAIDVYNQAGTHMNSSGLTSTTWDSRGVCWISWGSTDLASNINYTANVVVTRNNTYSTSLVVNLTSAKQLSALETSVGTGLGGAVSDIQTSVGTNLGTKVNTLQADVTTLKSDSTSIKTAVGVGQGTVLYSDVSTAKANIATVMAQVGTGNISAIKTKTDTIDWTNVTGLVTSAGAIKAKTDTIDWTNVTAIKTKTDTIDWTNVTGIKAKTDTILWTDVTTAKANVATLITEVGTGNISAIKTKTDTINWANITGIVTTEGQIKAKTDTIDWTNVTAIKTKTDTIDWTNVTGIKAKTDTILWTDVTTAKANVATLITEVGTGNISAIKTKTDSINWSDVTGIVTTSGAIKTKTDTIDWTNVTAIKTKTDTIDWTNVTGIKAKTDTILWTDVTTAKANVATLITEVGTGNISAIKTKTDTINWANITGIVTTEGQIKAKTDTIDWTNVTAIKTKTDTIDWTNVTGIKAKTDTILWTDVTTAKANVATLITEVGTGNISAIKTKTDSINWSDVTGIVTTSGAIKTKTDTIDWTNVTAIKTKTDTIDWTNVTGIKAKTDTIDWTEVTTAKNNIATILTQTNNIGAIKTITDTIDWTDVTGLVTTAGVIQAKTDNINWTDISAIKTKTTTISWDDVTGIKAKTDDITWTDVTTAKNNIATVMGEIGTGNISTILTKTNTIDWGDVTGLVTTSGAIQAKTDDINWSDISAIQTKTTTISWDDVTGIKAKTDDITWTDVTTAKNNIATVMGEIGTGNISTILTKTNTINWGDVTGLVTTSGAIQAKTDDINWSDISAIQTKTATISWADVTGIKAKTDDITWTDVTTAKNNIATVMGQIGTGNIDAIRTATDSINWTDVTGLVTTAGVIQAKTDNINWTDISAIKTKTATISWDDVTGIKTKTDDINWSDITTAKADVATVMNEVGTGNISTILTKTNTINWTDVTGLVTTSGAIQAKTDNINWTDVTAIKTKTATIRWDDVAGIKTKTDTIDWTSISDIATKINTVSTETPGVIALTTKVDALTSALSTIGTNIDNVKSIVGSTSDGITANTLYGKLSNVSTNVNALVTNWDKYDVSAISGYVTQVQEYLGGPNDPCGLLTVFGKIACVYSQTGDVPTITALADQANREVQQLRTEINFNGKTDTAYDLVKSIDDTVTEIKDSTSNITQQATDAEVGKMTKSVEETREALKKAATEAGVKSVTNGINVPGDVLPSDISSIRTKTSTINWNDVTGLVTTAGDIKAKTDSINWADVASIRTKTGTISWDDVTGIKTKTGNISSRAEEAKNVPATLDNLQREILELKAMTEVIKKAMESQQQPVVKTWFEPAEKTE